MHPDIRDTNIKYLFEANLFNDNEEELIEKLDDLYDK